MTKKILNVWLGLRRSVFYIPFFKNNNDNKNFQKHFLIYFLFYIGV